MNKIDIKINSDKIIAINDLLQKIYDQEPTDDQSAKVIISIWHDLADKFEKKYNSKIKKQGLFDSKKLTKFSLKYHEAWALKSILVDFKQFSTSEFYKTSIQSVINSLDQKLA